MNEQQAAELGARVRELIARGDVKLRMLLREQVIIDWIIQLARQDGAPGWLTLVSQDAVNGDLGPEMRSWINEVAASADDSATKDESLGYALGMVDVVLDVLAGRPQALDSLKRLTGRDFAGRFKELARMHGYPAENARQDTISVLFELIAEITDAGIERGHRRVCRNQRAALATAIDHAISDHTGGKRERHPQPDPLDQEMPADAPMLTLEEGIALQEALAAATLTERQRELIQLRLQGLEGKGLADALGIRVGSAEKLEARAIQEIRKISERDGGDF